jgi:uncharacterized protein YcfL
MKKITTFCLTALVILAGCSSKGESYKSETVNGIIHHINTDVPNDPDAKLELKKIFTISSEAQTDSNAFLKRPLAITVDKTENIYILDLLSMSVKKFDSEGKFISSIGRMGQGPGELFYPSTIFIFNDTLNVMSAGTGKLSKFDTQGNFYSDKMLSRDFQLQMTKFSRDGSKSASYVMKQIQKDGAMPDIDYGLSVINVEDLSIKSSLVSKVLSMQDLMAGKIDLSDLIIPFVRGNDFVYMSENSDSQYRVFCYDFEGNKKEEIRRGFKKIRYEDTEKKEYLEQMKKMSQGVQEIKVGNFKKAIANINTDKYGRLLVIPNVDRNEDKDGVYADIFKDGVFLNRVPYTIRDNESTGLAGMFQGQEFFIGDRLYVINAEDLTIDVYDY